MKQSNKRIGSIFGIIDYFLVFFLLAALIVLPVLTLWDLIRSAAAPLIHDGDWLILKASRATVWMSLFLLIAPVAVAMAIRAGFDNNPDYQIFQSDAGLWGLPFAAFTILISIWLLARNYFRKIRYDQQYIFVGPTRYEWNNLISVGFETSTTENFIIPNGLIMSAGKMDSSVLTLRFNPDKKIIVRPDMMGRNQFITDLKKIAKREKIRFITFKKPKKPK